MILLCKSLMLKSEQQKMKSIILYLNRKQHFKACKACEDCVRRMSTESDQRCWVYSCRLSCVSVWVVAIWLLGWCVCVCWGVGHVHTAGIHPRTHTQTTETLLILANGGGRGGWWLHIHVCEVNTFLTFQHFQKRRELWDQHSLLGFSTSLNCFF